jgi:serine phosphatase RsbU (regulator of sigma subunit)
VPTNRDSAAVSLTATCRSTPQSHLKRRWRSRAHDFTRAEHRIAETLQQALLEMPRGTLGIEHREMYRSADELTRVGGDFYDIFELDAGRIGIAIGDVSGKGLRAASLTSTVRIALRALALEGRSPRTHREPRE